MGDRPLRRKARIVLVLGVSALAAVLLLALKPEAERSVPPETGRLVETIVVRPEAVPLVIEAFGTVRPREALNLAAEVKGQIVRLHPQFTEGGFIRAGELLVEIDPRSFRLEAERRRIQVEQSRAELGRLEQEVANLKALKTIAQSDLALAQEDFARSRSLAAKQVLAQSAAEKAEQKYLAALERLQGIENQLALTGPMRRQLVAQQEMARVMHQQAELDLEKTRIVSPYDGYLLEKAVETGQSVSVGQLLGRIYRAGELEVDVHVPVKDLAWLPEDPEAIAAEVVFDHAGSGLAFPGRVSRTKARMEENTRTLPLVVAIAPDPERSPTGLAGLRPGMFVNVRLQGRTAPAAFRLPRHAVYAGDLVYTVREERLRATPVRVLRAYREHLVVDQGLEPGERVVVTPLTGAADGMKVRVREAAGDPAGRPAN
jgi:multidrug efflux pump subunit AcrA (membrane-fusion protein)